MRYGSIEEAPPLQADHRLWHEIMRLRGYDKMVSCRYNKTFAIWRMKSGSSRWQNSVACETSRATHTIAF